MSIIIFFVVTVAAISLWWLFRQGLTAKPWLQQGAIGELPGAEMHKVPAAKIGLGVFLAVVGCLFALLISSYFIRMDAADWRPLPIPTLLWFNMGILIASSAGLQWAKRGARKGAMDDVSIGLLIGGFCAALFLVGQLLAWRLLAASGYFVASNPASAFFYLITGMHGLHLAGGLVALGRTVDRLWRGVPLSQLQSSIGLCTTYWHFLLILWLVLFAMLAGYAGDFVNICRVVLS